MNNSFNNSQNLLVSAVSLSSIDMSVDASSSTSFGLSDSQLVLLQTSLISLYIIVNVKKTVIMTQLNYIVHDIKYMYTIIYTCTYISPAG